MKGRGNWKELVIICAIVAGLAWAFRGSGVVVVDVERPPVAVRLEGPEPPLYVADADGALLARLMPHFRRAAAEEIKAEFAKVAADLDAADPAAGHPLGGFGTTLGVAIAWLVKKIVYAIIASVILAVLLSLLWANWQYPALFMACWLATTALVSKLVAAREVGKSLKPKG